MRLFLFIFLVPVLTACDFLSENFSENMEVELVFPSMPGYVESSKLPIRMEIESYLADSSGTERVFTEIDYWGHSSGYLFRMSKRVNTPVLATPVMEGVNITLKPAGAVFPASSDASSVHRYSEQGRSGVKLFLSWDLGPLAEMLLRLAKQSFPVESINVERLSREIEDLSLTEPWFLDTDYLASKLLSGKFRVTYIRERALFSEEFIPGRGDWFFNLPSSPVFSVEDGDSFTWELSEGFYYLSNLSLSSFYSVFIDSEGNLSLEKERF